MTKGRADTVFNTLSLIGKELNSQNIKWGVGASILLNQYGLSNSTNDIDIVVDMKDIDKLDRIMQKLGSKKAKEKSGTYSTKFFYEYIVNEIDVDVMAGLAINHELGTYHHIFDKLSISRHVNINGVDIPFMSLVDWYIIYQLIPGREAKVKIIEDYLIQNGMSELTLVIRALESNLPQNVRERTTRLIELSRGK